MWRWSYKWKQKWNDTLNRIITCVLKRYFRNRTVEGSSITKVPNYVSNFLNDTTLFILTSCEGRPRYTYTSLRISLGGWLRIKTLRDPRTLFIHKHKVRRNENSCKTFRKQSANIQPCAMYLKGWFFHDRPVMEIYLFFVCFCAKTCHTFYRRITYPSKWSRNDWNRPGSWPNPV